MFRRISGVVAGVCITLGGCMQLQPQLTSAQYSSLPPAEAVGDVAALEGEDDASYFREYAPWKAQARRPAMATAQAERKPDPQVKVASAARSLSDAVVTGDPASKSQAHLLRPEHRDKLIRESLTDADLDGRRITRSICSGC